MRTTVILSVVCVAVGSAGPVPGHARVADTCFGLPATIVAAPGADLVLGTDGDDVVVATDVAQVSTLGGKDAICVSGPSHIDAGSGDDRVLSTAASGASTVVLGSGSDLFEGSSGDDEVWTERVEGGVQVPDEDFGTADTVRTWGGADVVHSGVWVHPNHDEVDLGDGPDTVHFSGNSGPASLTGGTGRDRFETWFVPVPWPPVTFDLEAGTATFQRNGQEEAYATLDAFEDLSVTTLSPVTVRGTVGPDRISVDGPGTVDAGAGNDELVLRGDPDAVRGGPGRDTVTMKVFSDDVDRRVVYDLGRGELTRAGRTVPFEAEVLRVRGREDRTREHVRVIGSARRDDVVVAACGAAVRGGAGPDRLRADSRGCGPVPTTVRGGRGADLLLGGNGRDVLLGGPGHDRAVGRRGADWCRAEDEQGCERG